MSVPIVLVTTDTGVFNDLSASVTPATYLDAAARAGLAPVQLPTISESFAGDAILDMAAGVLVTGARSNLHPSNYHAPAPETAGPFDEARDRTSLPLIRAALDEGLPLFCICRGMQELNVVCGGTLHTALHEVPGRFDHRAPVTTNMDERYSIRHDAIIQPGGRLSGILGASQVRVNSAHGQGIDQLGEGLVVEAVAEDGTVEAVSATGHPFALGVQWHPEYLVRTDEPSQALFDAFAAAVRAFANARAAHAAA